MSVDALDASTHSPWMNRHKKHNFLLLFFIRRETRSNTHIPDWSSLGLMINRYMPVQLGFALSIDRACPPLHLKNPNNTYLPSIFSWANQFLNISLRGFCQVRPHLVISYAWNLWIFLYVDIVSITNISTIAFL